MLITEFLNYRKDLLDSSKDDEGFVQQTLFISQVLPLMVDAKLLDSEDWNESYYLNPIDNLKINGYTVNESSERLQLFIIDEDSVGVSKIETDLQISNKIQYDSQFKRVTRFLNKAVKGHLNDEVQDADPIRPLLSQLSSSIGLDQFDVVEIFLITATATVETRGSIPTPKRIEFEDEYLPAVYTKKRDKMRKDILIIKRLVDLNFMYDVMVSQGNREALTIDFHHLFDYKIEAIKAAEEENFESYLCVLPALILSNLYRRFSSRLLEKNVRSFLQFKGVNKGIRETIRTCPERFIAYNNGITITAIAKEVENIDGKVFIKSLTDFQIVNGGQTTASIYFTQKDGFSIEKVKVMAKINIARDVSEEGLDALISDISKYSNSQTKVSNVDLSSRNPQLSKLKALSESVVTPSGRKWFFERSRGDFNTKLRIAGSNKARIEKEYPPKYRFSKEQLGKYYTAWGDQPYVVKKGGEKVFRYFLEEITNEVKGRKTVIVNREFYEELISKIILFTELEKIYGQGKKAFGQMRSAVIPYSISILYLYADGTKQGKQFDLQKIWKKEKLDDDLGVFFTHLMKLMNELIKKYSESDDYGEYAKNKNLWDTISCSREIKEFMASSLSREVLGKYVVPEKQKVIVDNDVDFGKIQKTIEIHSKGREFYEVVLKKYEGLSEHKRSKLELIISSILRLDDLSEDMLEFESNLINEIRRSDPVVFDSCVSTQNYLLENTLKFIILKFNQAREAGIDVLEYFQSIEKKAVSDGMLYSSVFSTMGAKLSNGYPPTMKDIHFASNYFISSGGSDTTLGKSGGLEKNMNHRLLKMMVEWDSKMRILTPNERSYIADLAYELKPLNSFHKTHAEKHLQTLIKAGFKPS